MIYIYVFYVLGFYGIDWKHDVSSITNIIQQDKARQDKTRIEDTHARKCALLFIITILGLAMIFIAEVQWYELMIPYYTPLR